MALKAVVTTLEGIPEALHTEYKQGDGGKFFLDVEGLETDEHPAVGTLARAKKREKESREKAELAAREAREKLEALNVEMVERLKGVIPKADADRLEQSYKTKMDESVNAVRNELTTERDSLASNLRRVLVVNVAQRISADLAGENADLLQPHILPRLAVEMVNGEAVTRVLDVEGKPSASTLDDLRKELLSTKKFFPILIGSKASGGGASGNSGGGGGGAINLATATEAQKVQHYKAKQGIK